MEQGGLAGDGEDGLEAAVVLGLELRKNARAGRRVRHERGVEGGDAEVGFGEGDFDVADEVDEERELAGHVLEQGKTDGVLGER